VGNYGTIEIACLVLSIGILLFFSIDEAKRNKKDKDE